MYSQIDERELLEKVLAKDPDDWSSEEWWLSKHLPYTPTPEPQVRVPLPQHGGAPECPICGYVCGCSCYDRCQTPCPTPDSDGDCDCRESCHGGHEPWDCGSFTTRYYWARQKVAAIILAAGDYNI